MGRLEKLFEADPKVTVEKDYGKPKATVRVEGQAKAEAIERLLPDTVEFGNVTLEVEVVPSNAEATEADCFRAAFEGNPIMDGVAEGYGPAGDIAFALFVPETVQLREDDISEFGGLSTLTCAELAESVLLGHRDVLVSSAAKE